MYGSHIRRRRRTPVREPRRAGSVFAFFAFIFLLAVFTHFAFPRFSKAIGDKVDSVTNYRAAFSAIGEGLSGERRITEAFSEAWDLAFSPAKIQESDGESVFTAQNSSAKTEENESVSESNKEFSDAVSAGAIFYPDEYGGGSLGI